MSIALLTNVQDDASRKFAEEFSRACGDFRINDHVIFYTDTYDESIDCDTSVIDSYGLWAFSGTLIFTSMVEITKFLNITSDIKFAYYPDLDNQYDPIRCLYYREKYQVHCIDDAVNSKVCRTLGNNIKVKKHENINKMLEDLA